MSKTLIDWTDYSWNPITGCTPISPGCARCYAKSIATRFKDTKAFPNGFDVTLHPERLEQPLHWRKPRRVFLCSAGDLFHEDVPFEFIDRVFHTIEMCRPRGHILQILTKRPERLLRYYEKRNADFGPDILPHVWFGVTAENQEMADERIPKLLEVPAAVRFVSIEPMLGPVDLTGICVSPPQAVRIACNMGPLVWYSQYLDALAGKIQNNGLGGCITTKHRKLDWVIVGGETGPGARPMHPDWARSVRDQCQAAGVPYFHKQNGEWIFTEKLRGYACDFQETGGYPDSCRAHPGCEDCYPFDFYGKAKSIEVEGGYMVRVGKRRAGHLLDGVEHREFPEVG